MQLDLFNAATSTRRCPSRRIVCGSIMVHVTKHLVSMDQKIVAKCSAISWRMAMQLKAAGVIGYVLK